MRENRKRAGAALRRGWTGAAFAAALAAAAFAADAPTSAPPLEPGATTPVFPPLAHAPLDGPLVLTGSFGEHRNSHVHAGLDFSTAGTVGHPVYAPLDGVIDRVRASGAGYGRAIYLHADDGRLIVLAHLDAYDEPLASYVAAAQDSSGEYEQDLWPAAGRFRVKAGQRLGWSGRSGTGTPHLHFEVRRGDMALNPLRAGVAARDTQPPEIAALTLEPLDEASMIEGGAGPYTLRLGARAETLSVTGRVRAVVQAVDPGERRSSMAPWNAGVAWGGMRCEWRADSISWATDLPEVDYIYDLGRAAPFAKTTMSLWAAAGVRPRTCATNVPRDRDAGVIEVERGAPARPLVVFARDLAGHEARRVVWLAGATATRPNVLATGEPRTSPRWDLAGLPAGAVRLEFRGGARAHRDVKLDGRAATYRDGVWSVVIARAPAGAWRLRASGVDAAGGAWSDTVTVWTMVEPGATPAAAGAPWTAASRFEPGPIAIATDVDPLELPAELKQVQPAFDVLPAGTPLRAAWRFASQPLGPWERGPRVSLYHVGREGWEWCGGLPDTVRNRILADSRLLGRFAVCADTTAPRVTVRRPPHTAKRGVYSTWALAAVISEDGSGLDARRSHFVVDGRTVPSEWDGVRAELRWRPLKRPARGTHHWELIAVDRAGNLARRSGTFVLD